MKMIARSRMLALAFLCIAPGVGGRFLRHESSAVPVRQSSDAAELEDRLLSAVSSMKGGSSDDISALFEPLLDNMEAAINSSHAAAQANLNNLTLSFDNCGEARDQGAAAASGLMGTVGTKSEEHKQCRDEESTRKNASDECQGQVGILQSAKTAACNAYEAVAKVPSVDLVPPPAATEEYGSWLLRVQTWATDELASLGSLKASCVNATGALSSKVVLCEGSDGNGGTSAEYTAQKEQCDGLQSALESAACQHAAKVDEVCENYAGCYSSANEQWDMQTANAQAEAESRKQEWWMLQRIRCYLNVFVSAGGATIDEEQIEECKNASHVADWLTLTYPQLPAAPGICTPAEAPCDESFVSAEYSSLPSNAPAKACTACAAAPVPTTVPTTAPTTPPTIGFVALTKTAGVFRCSSDPALGCSELFPATAMAAYTHTFTRAMNGDFIIAEVGGADNTWVDRCTEAGECAQFGNGFSDWSSPAGISSFSNGDVIVADLEQNSLFRCTDAGSCWTALELGTRSPFGVAVAPNGEVLVTFWSEGTVDRCNLDIGSCVTVATGLSKPGSVAVADNGDYIIGEKDGNRVQRCPASGSGECTTIVGTGVCGSSAAQVCGPRGLRVLPSGAILIADHDNGRVQLCPADGSGACETVAQGLAKVRDVMLLG